MDWSELNPDLLRQIAKKVKDISDFVRLRAVCKQWRSAVHPSDLPPQLPYFIQCTRNNNLFEFQFRPIYSDKTHNLIVRILWEPEVSSILYGSFTGFVLLRCLEAPISGLILNPLTGFQALLPISNMDSFMPLYFGPSYSHEPNLVENGIDLVGWFGEERPNAPVVQKVILWRYTDRKWRMITEMCYSHDECVLSYSSGRVYAISEKTRYIRVVDVTNGNTVSLLPSLSKPFHHIFEACGDLIGVQHCYRPEGLNIPEIGFMYELYQLKDCGTNPFWAKVNDIGDRMLFYNDVQSCNWLCLKASDFEGWKGNCIYSKSFRINNSVKCYSVASCDMMGNTTQLHLFPGDYNNIYNNTWFLPNLC